MLMLFAIAMPVGGKLKFTGFPDIEGDVLEARILLPQGTPLARTEGVVQHLQEVVWSLDEEFKPAQPDGQNLVQNLTVIFGENPDAYETGPHVARIVVDLLSADERNTTIEEFRNSWREGAGQLTDVIALKFAEPTIGPGGRAIDVRLIGTDLDEIKAAALELKNWLTGFDGAIDLNDDLRPGKREYRLRLKEGAGVIGLDADNVANQVRAAFQGFKTDEFPLGPETYEVELRLDHQNRSDIADLEQLSICLLYTSDAADDASSV